ncbi:MAG: hypothetical protein IPL33_03340 [Sphingobacteriales bacterium]|nr:hypothetical protein [Sphingobacteriales bacterium]MCC7224574.1 hypothetical protein [Chitinophagales bacterium]
MQVAACLSRYKLSLLTAVPSILLLDEPQIDKKMPNYRIVPTIGHLADVIDTANNLKYVSFLASFYMVN